MLTEDKAGIGLVQLQIPAVETIAEKVLISVITKLRATGLVVPKT